MPPPWSSVWRPRSGCSWSAPARAARSPARILLLAGLLVQRLQSRGRLGLPAQRPCHGGPGCLAGRVSTRGRQRADLAAAPGRGASQQPGRAECAGHRPGRGYFGRRPARSLLWRAAVLGWCGPGANPPAIRYNAKSVAPASRRCSSQAVGIRERTNSAFRGGWHAVTTPASGRHVSSATAMPTRGFAA